jgi:hypothetical protein
MAILYDSNGNAIFPVAPTGAYLSNINVRHTAADVTASVVWAMTNPSGSGKSVYIRNIRGRVTFDGTAVAATSLGYEFIRYSGNVSPTTGTTVPRIKKKTTQGASVVQDINIQQKSGILTLASAVFEAAPFNVVRLPIAVTNGIASFDLDFAVAGLPYEGVEILAGEGLAIRLNTAAVIGLAIAGSVEWEER